MPDTTLALRYHEYGDPYEKLVLEEMPLRNIEPDETLIEMLACAINPADFGRIMGVYGSKATLPATAGLEGVGRIIKRGENATRFNIGDRVALPASSGPWQSHLIAKDDQLYPVPDFLSDAQAAIAWINPATAWLMLHQFAALQPGDWVMQNAATGAVGKLVIQFAHHLGLKTINLVRNLDATEHLKSLGADLVFLDERDSAKQVKTALDGARPKLGLNAVGAPSASLLANCIADGASVVTYGGMDRTPSTMPTGRLIFSDIAYRGFWVSKWYAETPPSEIEAVHKTIFSLMEKENIATEIAAAYPLAQFKEALAHSQKPGKKGKVIFQSEG